MLDPQLIHTYTEVPVVVDAVDWCRDHLSADEIAYLGTFQPSLDVALDGTSSLVLFHGTLRSHMEDLLATTPPRGGRREADGPARDVGHTHLQMEAPAHVPRGLTRAELVRV